MNSTKSKQAEFLEILTYPNRQRIRNMVNDFQTAVLTNTSAPVQVVRSYEQIRTVERMLFRHVIEIKVKAHHLPVYTEISKVFRRCCPKGVHTYHTGIQSPVPSQTDPIQYYTAIYYVDEQ